MKPYYYVYRYGYGMPTIRHATLKEAQAEAERLAKKHQGFQFEILEFKGISSLHNSITFWADGVDPDDDDYVRDGHGNEWAKCGPDCDMEVVRPGKVQCSCIEFESQVETGLTNETESKQTRQLERELAEMREQRDRLMFALQNVMDYRQGKPPYDFHQYRESERDNMAHDAWQVVEQNCLSLLSEITTSDRSDVNAIND